jgi:hypothetical protein
MVVNDLSKEEREVLRAMENDQVFSYPHLSAKAKVLPRELSNVVQGLREKGLIIERSDPRVIGGKVIAISENGCRKLNQRVAALSDPSRS